MSNGAFPDRVTMLRNRWEADPSSRIFLQLAEEYRHQGRVREALDVLDRGLKEHPGYLSALVAKGRCHLELGEPEPAKAVLERVVKQDATQMVANKLLVRAHLETGEPDRARERLDLYTLLNDGDPEIDDLRRRLREMEQPPQAEKPGSTPPLDRAPAEAPSRRESASAGNDIFDLGFPAPRAAVSPGEPFADLLASAPAAAPAEEAAAAPFAAPAAVAEAAEPEEEPEPEDVLFRGLASRESRRRYLDSLGAEGIFLLDLTPAAPAWPQPVEPSRMQGPYGEPILARAAAPEPLPIEPAVETSEIPWETVAEVAPEPDAPEAPVQEEEAPVFELAERTPWAEAPAPLDEEAPVTELVATATLGELYLKQGHLGEAERIFREVLRREPDNAPAREGLARAAAPGTGSRPLAAQDLLAGYEPAAGEAEAKARKAWVLNSYLQRLRRGNQRDVS